MNVKSEERKKSLSIWSVANENEVNKARNVGFLPIEVRFDQGRDRAGPHCPFWEDIMRTSSFLVLTEAVRSKLHCASIG